MDFKKKYNKYQEKINELLFKKQKGGNIENISHTYINVPQISNKLESLSQNKYEHILIEIEKISEPFFKMLSYLLSNLLKKITELAIEWFNTMSNIMKPSLKELKVAEEKILICFFDYITHYINIIYKYVIYQIKKIDGDTKIFINKINNIFSKNNEDMENIIIEYQKEHSININIYDFFDVLGKIYDKSELQLIRDKYEPQILEAWRKMNVFDRLYKIYVDEWDDNVNIIIEKYINDITNLLDKYDNLENFIYDNSERLIYNCLPTWRLLIVIIRPLIDEYKKVFGINSSNDAIIKGNLLLIHIKKYITDIRGNMVQKNILPKLINKLDKMLVLLDVDLSQINYLEIVFIGYQLFDIIESEYIINLDGKQQILISEGGKQYLSIKNNYVDKYMLNIKKYAFNIKNYISGYLYK